MNTPDEVYERIGDALGYASGAALSPTERLIADVAYHYRTVQAIKHLDGLSYRELAQAVKALAREDVQKLREIFGVAP